MAGKPELLIKQKLRSARHNNINEMPSPFFTNT